MLLKKKMLFRCLNASVIHLPQLIQLGSIYTDTSQLYARRCESTPTTTSVYRPLAVFRADAFIQIAPARTRLIARQQAKPERRLYFV